VQTVQALFWGKRMFKINITLTAFFLALLCSSSPTQVNGFISCRTLVKAGGKTVILLGENLEDPSFEEHYRQVFQKNSFPQKKSLTCLVDMSLRYSLKKEILRFNIPHPKTQLKINGFPVIFASRSCKKIFQPTQTTGELMHSLKSIPEEGKPFSEISHEMFQVINRDKKHKTSLAVEGYLAFLQGQIENLELLVQTYPYLQTALKRLTAAKKKIGEFFEKVRPKRGLIRAIYNHFCNQLHKNGSYYPAKKKGSLYHPYKEVMVNLDTLSSQIDLVDLLFFETDIVISCVSHFSDIVRDQNRKGAHTTLFILEEPYAAETFDALLECGYVLKRNISWYVPFSKLLIKGCTVPDWFDHLIGYLPQIIATNGRLKSLDSAFSCRSLEERIKYLDYVQWILEEPPPERCLPKKKVEEKKE